MLPGCVRAVRRWNCPLDFLHRRVLIGTGASPAHRRTIAFGCTVDRVGLILLIERVCPAALPGVSEGTLGERDKVAAPVWELLSVAPHYRVSHCCPSCPPGRAAKRAGSCLPTETTSRSFPVGNAELALTSVKRRLLPTLPEVGHRMTPRGCGRFILWRCTKTRRVER
jgi:hypothetical protein